MTKILSAREEVLLAALKLTESGNIEFTEWNLTVATWKFNVQRWGLRGYENLYPDHKRVMNEIMAKGDRRLLTLGLLERTKTNTYKLTKAGTIQAQYLVGDRDSRERANYKIYDVINKYIHNNAFIQFIKDSSKPTIWLHIASFYDLTASMEPQRAVAKINEFNQYIKQAEKAIDELGDESLRRTSSGKAISKKDIEKLKEFHRVVLKRFRLHFDALLDENK